MLRPLELQTDHPIWFDGIETSTTAVWETLAASYAGDLERVRSLVAGDPILACCKYNYAPPIHFAVREGHTELVRFLLAHGGFLPDYHIDGFNEPLVNFALDRGHLEVVNELDAVERNPSLAAPCVAPTDDMRIAFPGEEERVRFRQLLDQASGGNIPLSVVDAALAERPELARDPYQYWGEGVMAGPANSGNVELIELLLRHGAQVPEVSKWCARYYFKHYETAALLMAGGMNPNHMNWHHVTLLHELAWAGERRKLELLLDHGAEPNPIDEELLSTPLGLAAREGRLEIVELLLDRGAEPDLAGAPWATPQAWARLKGHSGVEALLGQ